MKMSRLSTGLVAAVCLACGGGGGSSSGSNNNEGGNKGTVSNDLHGALFQEVKVAPVVSTHLLRQNGKDVADAELSFLVSKGNVPGFGTALLGLGGVYTDAEGTAAVAIPADEYEQYIGFRESASASSFLAGYPSGMMLPLSVTGDVSRTYQADQYKFNVTSPVEMTAFTLSVYQTNVSGTVDYGTGNYVLQPFSDERIGTDFTQNPAVFSYDFTLQPGSDGHYPKVFPVNVELFAGNYRTVLTVIPKDNVKVATNISSTFAVTGAGKTVSRDVVVSQAERVLTVILHGADGKPLAGGPYTLRFSEPSNFPFWGSLGETTTDAEATGSLMVDKTLSKVAVDIVDTSTANEYLLGTYVFGATESTVTLTQVQVEGNIKPFAGAIDPAATPVVMASTKTGLGFMYDGMVVQGTQTSSPWHYTFKLLGSPAGMTYVLQAAGIKGFPDSQRLEVTVKTAALDKQDITVSPGGVIMGKLQDESHNDLPGVTVQVWRATGGTIEEVTETSSDANGDYAVQVPYGTYFLVVGGAVTTDVVVSAQAPEYVKDLTRYSVNGRVTKAQGGSSIAASSASVYSGYSTATTDALGVYSMKVFEGQNYFCAVPASADPTYGFVCQTNVMVDDTTVAASRK